MTQFDKELARQRSNQDAKSSNDYGRAAAQLSILINGGAATAILAYLAQIAGDSIAISHAAPYALVGYAIGVVFGTRMMFLMMKCAEDWADYWLNIASGEKADDTSANEWYKKARRCFGLAMTCFVGSSLLIGGALIISA